MACGWLAYRVENIVLKCLRNIIIQSTAYQCSKKTRKGKAEGKKSKSRRKTKEDKNPTWEMWNQLAKKEPKGKENQILIFTLPFHCVRILYGKFTILSYLLLFFAQILQDIQEPKLCLGFQGKWNSHTRTKTPYRT